MNNSTDQNKKSAIRRKRCEGCGQCTDMKLLYRIRDRDLCLACGNKEIAEWNQFVKDAEAQL